jgi:hypothetical protein
VNIFDNLVVLDYGRRQDLGFSNSWTLDGFHFNAPTASTTNDSLPLNRNSFLGLLDTVAYNRFGTKAVPQRVP